jgi:Protein kinase domain
MCKPGLLSETRTPLCCPSGGACPRPQQARARLRSVVLSRVLDHPSLCQAAAEWIVHIARVRTVRASAVFSSISLDSCVSRADREVGSVVLSRYRVERALGAGTSGTTYAAGDTRTGARVAVKELALGRLKTWKQFELFEREAATLRGLSHPNIPAYVDYKQEGGCFFLVQELAAGPTLAQLVGTRARLDDAAVERIARDLLSALAYLASRRCAARK